MDNAKAQLLAWASEGASTENPDQLLGDGYTGVKTFDDPNTGFHAEVYRKDGTNEYIVAFTGTQNWQDVAADIALGRPQWEENKFNVINYLNERGATEIDFTGRSLGGGLAQYAAYDYLKIAQENNITPADVSLATYNAFGGMAGLEQMYGNIDSNLTSQIDGIHFFTESSSGSDDAISRVGEGHIGGDVYKVQMTEDVGMGAIHQAWKLGYFFDVDISQCVKTTPDYLQISGAQQMAALVAFYGDDGKFNNNEAFFRAAAGVLISLDLAPADQVDQVIDAWHPEFSIMDWGLVRDSLPLPVRAAVAILGMDCWVAAGETKIGVRPQHETRW